MMMRKLAFALGLMAFSGGVALADDSRERKDLELARPFARAFNDETVSLLFSYLRQSIRSTAEGKPAPQPPAELTKRMQDAGESLKRDSANAALGMLDEIERELKDALRESGGAGT